MLYTQTHLVDSITLDSKQQGSWDRPWVGAQMDPIRSVCANSEKVRRVWWRSVERSLNGRWVPILFFTRNYQRFASAKGLSFPCLFRSIKWFNFTHLSQWKSLIISSCLSYDKLWVYRQQFVIFFLLFILTFIADFIARYFSGPPQCQALVRSPSQKLKFEDCNCIEQETNLISSCWNLADVMWIELFLLKSL